MGKPAILKVLIEADASKAHSALGSTAGKFGKFGLAVGAAVAGAAVAVGVAAVKFGAASVRMASDVQQAQGAVSSVFGKSAKGIIAWSDTTAKSMGLSKKATLSMAAVMGAQLQGLGYATADSAKQTQILTQRAADMAATFGGDTQQAMEALTAAFRGERDPIEKYGVSIKQASVDAKVAAMGLDTSTTAAKQHSQAMATMAIIMDQTAKTQGTFGKESNTLAGQQARLSAQFDNVKNVVGQALLPIMTSLMGTFSDFLPIVMDLAKQFMSNLAPTFKSIQDAITQFLPQILAAAAAFGKSLGPAIASLGGTLAQLVPVVIKLAGIFLAQLLPQIVSVAKMVLTYLIPAVRTLAQQFITVVVPAVLALWKVVAINLIPIIQSIVRVVGPLLIPALKIAAIVLATLARVAGAILAPVLKALQPLFARLAKLVADNQGFINGLIGVVRFLSPILVGLAKIVGGVLSFALSGVVGLIIGVINAIEGIARAIGIAVDAIRSLISWIGKIKMPKISIPNPLGKSATATATLTTRAYRGVARAPATASTSSAGGVTINISGAVDPDATARQIRRILDRSDLRSGRRQSFVASWASP